VPELRHRWLPPAARCGTVVGVCSSGFRFGCVAVADNPTSTPNKQSKKKGGRRPTDVRAHLAV
jgi:hypothetical protein